TASGTAVSAQWMGYDANGRMIWQYVDGGRTDHTFDHLGRLVKVTQPDPDDGLILGGNYVDTPGSLPRPYVTYGYDLDGNQVAATNELGFTTDTTLDHLNRVAQVQQPAPSGTGSRPTTSYTYNTLGDRLTLTDPDSNTTTWTVDTWGNALTETNALNK